MRIHLFVILVYAVCQVRKADVPPRSHVQVNDDQQMKKGGSIKIRTSQSGQQQLYRGCGIPRMIQYPKVCTEGNDLRHCEIRSVFYNPVSKSGRTTWVPAAPCRTDEKSVLTLSDFAVFDKDGSGFIDTRELITASRVADEADGLFSTSDLNKDGFIDMCEFSKFPRRWKNVLDKIRYFYSVFNIPEKTFGCIEFIASFNDVHEAKNSTDTPFIGKMVDTPTNIDMLREEDQTFETNPVLKPSTEGALVSQLGGQLTADASVGINELSFVTYTGTPPTEGTSELQHGIQLTTLASVGTRKSPSVTETGTFLTRLGFQLITQASGGTRASPSFTDTIAREAVVTNGPSTKNINMTTGTISKTSDWHFDYRQWWSTMPTGTSADTMQIDVSPATKANVRDTKEIESKTGITDSGIAQTENTSGIYRKVHKTSESDSNDSQTWSTELPVTSTVIPEIRVPHAAKVSSKEKKIDDTKVHGLDKKVTSSVAYFTNQTDDEYTQDAKTAFSANAYQGTTAADTTEVFENGTPETAGLNSIRRNEKEIKQFQHIMDTTKNSLITGTTVNYEHITGYMPLSKNDLMVNKLIEINTSTEIPNKAAVTRTIISNEYNMVPADDRSAITNFPVQLATQVILDNKHHLGDANMDNLDVYDQQPSTYKSVYFQDETDDGRDSDTRNLVYVGTQPVVPITYGGIENLTQEELNISETTYANMEKERFDRQSLLAAHTSDSLSVSTKRTAQEDQVGVVYRDEISENEPVDEEPSHKNEMKMPYLTKIEPHYLDIDSFNAQRKMMNEMRQYMKAIRAFNIYLIQRHDRPGFPYRNRPPFLTYLRPKLSMMGVLLHSPHMTSFTRDIKRPTFVPEIKKKQVSFIPDIQMSTTGIGRRDQVKMSTDNNLGLQTSAVGKSNLHSIDQAQAQGIKDQPHEINNTNSFANSIFSKTIEQDKDGFPQPRKHKVQFVLQRNGIFNSTGSSTSSRYISKTFPNIMRAPEKTQEKTKYISMDTRYRQNIDGQQHISEPKKGIKKRVTFQTKPEWTKSFEFNEKSAKASYIWKNGDNSEEVVSYSDTEVDSDERSD